METQRWRWAAGLALILLGCATAPGGTIVGSGALGPGNLKVTEKGLKGQNFLIYPTWTDTQPTPQTHRFLNYDGTAWSQSVQMNQPTSDPDVFSGSVTVPAGHTSYDNGQKKYHKVSNYEQTTGDPGTLYAAVFAGGVMLDSIEDWFGANIPLGQEIIQPDFNLVGGGDVYYGVNLADLITAGGAFADTHHFGDIFTINNLGQLPELPMYVFSSTPLDYTAGVGWTGTLLAPGTQVFFNAAHATSVVPEPASSWLLTTACAGILAWRRRGSRSRRRAKAS